MLLTMLCINQRGNRSEGLSTPHSRPGGGKQERRLHDGWHRSCSSSRLFICSWSASSFAISGGRQRVYLRTLPQDPQHAGRGQCPVCIPQIHHSMADRLSYPAYTLRLQGGVQLAEPGFRLVGRGVSLILPSSTASLSLICRRIPTPLSWQSCCHCAHARR